MKAFFANTLIIAGLFLAACNPLCTAEAAPIEELTAPIEQVEPAGAEKSEVQPSPVKPAQVENDEGGAAYVSGEWAYTSYAVPTHFLEPVVALIDVSYTIQRNYSEYVPRTGQILGTLTSPLSPPPAKYRVNVPVLPSGAAVDLDNNGRADAGLQVFTLMVSTNLVGDSYLEQLEQSGFTSTLSDPQTGYIREGTLLVFAPDDSQGFPSAAGDDGLFFTADDPIAILPAGYTLATLSPDGSVSFDRSREARMDTLEPAAESSPDFSDQGILESYNSLIDMLKVRYSYTELRGLDWEQMRQQYLPQVEEAEKTNDMQAYYTSLFDLAMSIRDSHVQVKAVDASIRLAPIIKIANAYNGNLGAKVVELSDGRFITIFLDPAGPGAQAGWQFGTEIVSVDGVPMTKRLDAIPLVAPESTPEGIRTAQLPLALSFPAGTQTTIEYRLPGDTELRSVNLTAGDFLSEAPKPGTAREEISFKELDGGYGYIQWGAFNDPLYKLAVWERFLSSFHEAPGIIIDLRDNGGGNLGLLYTMVSSFFPEDQPAPTHWIDTYVYDEKSNSLVKAPTTEYTTSSPKPEITYNGAVVVLVNENSASAAEYFPQFLQRQGRAVVVGEHGTDGAGGFIEVAALPGGISFQFTKVRSVFAGTDEFNLEGKGVTLDVRVPITEENEQAKLEGRDPVLEAALVALGEEVARMGSEMLVGTTWKLVLAVDPGSARQPIESPENYTITFNEDGTMSIKADCNMANASYTIGDAGVMTITPGPTTLALCPGGSLGEDFLKWLGGTQSFQTDGKVLVFALDPSSGMEVLQFEIVD